MLRRASEVNGFTIGASDGSMGAVSDLLFDDSTWLVRWFVVNTGHILPGRKVLLPPLALGHVNHIGDQLSVRLTKKQVMDSPDINTDQPVSRHMESNLYDYYGWTPHWSTGFYMGGYGYAGSMIAPRLPVGSVHREREHAQGQVSSGDPNLRSVHEVSRYHIHARDGEIGHVADFLIEDVDWSIHYLVVDTKNWWPGRKVLVSPNLILDIDWSDQLVTLSVNRKLIEDSPVYDEKTMLDRAYEHEFHAHYGGAEVKAES
jgi:hypothetical protein